MTPHTQPAAAAAAPVKQPVPPSSFSVLPEPPPVHVYGSQPLNSCWWCCCTSSLTWAAAAAVAAAAIRRLTCPYFSAIPQAQLRVPVWCCPPLTCCCWCCQWCWLLLHQLGCPHQQPQIYGCRQNRNAAQAGGECFDGRLLLHQCGCLRPQPRICDYSQHGGTPGTYTSNPINLIQWACTTQCGSARLLMHQQG